MVARQQRHRPETLFDPVAPNSLLSIRRKLEYHTTVLNHPHWSANRLMGL